MRCVDRLLRRGLSAAGAVADRTDAGCPHVTLIPHWDSPSDMGREERASSFRCDACGTTFTPAEASELRRTEAARMAHLERRS